MSWIHLAPLVDPSPWNGVTITTAILSVVAIVVTLLVLGLTWANIPKVYWDDVSVLDLTTNPPRWKMQVVNRGVGEATDVYLYLEHNKEWDYVDKWDSIGQTGSVHRNVNVYPADAVLRFQIRWRAHPFPSRVRKKTIRLKQGAQTVLVDPHEVEFM